MRLSPTFDQALVYASDVHRDQPRKETEIPYVSHLLGVCALVLVDGGEEDEAIAALLHDAAEDHGGAERIADIRSTFGDRVAHIVEACSDTLEDPKPDWRPRKEAYLAHLHAEKDPGILRVSLADKLDNSRAILRDLKLIGDEVWPRFNAGKEGQLWYYRSLVEAFRGRVTSPMLEELERVVSEIEALSR